MPAPSPRPGRLASWPQPPPPPGCAAARAARPSARACGRRTRAAARRRRAAAAGRRSQQASRQHQDGAHTHTHTGTRGTDSTCRQPHPAVAAPAALGQRPQPGRARLGRQRLAPLTLVRRHELRQRRGVGAARHLRPDRRAQPRSQLVVLRQLRQRLGLRLLQRAEPAREG